MAHLPSSAAPPLISAQAHDSAQPPVPGQPGPRLTTFTLHTPAQGQLHAISTGPGPGATVTASVQNQIQIQSQNQIQTAASIIHSGGLSLPGSAGNPSSSVISIIPSTGPVATLPGNVRSVSVFSAKAQPSINAIGPRFQVSTGNGPQAGPQSINLLIHPQDQLGQKSLFNVTGHSTIQTTAAPPGTVIKANLGPGGAILTSANTNASGPLYIQTNPSLLTSQTANILPVGPNPGTQVTGAQLSSLTLQSQATSQQQNSQQQQQQQQQQQTQQNQLAQQQQQQQNPQQSSQQQSQPQQQQQQSQSIGPPQFPKLKVEDALTYLDKVKLRFNEQPQVYNDFLDIMKEFKSQSIDTPGVIHRVSTLFKGFPELIVGFNTFLPPGYKIDICGNELNVSTPNNSNILVMTSGGNFIQQHIAHPNMNNTANNSASIQNGIMNNVTNLQTHQQAQQQPPAQQTYVSADENPTYARSTLIKSEAFNDLNNFSERLCAQPASGPRNAKNLHRVHTNSESNNSVKQGAEFNNAIAYVNKIKTRFHSRPDVYKEFLDILQSFQNNPDHQSHSDKAAHEKIIFEKVAVLFEDHNDLLEEFNQFLPDSTASRTVQNSVGLKNSSNSLSGSTGSTANSGPGNALAYRIQSDGKPQLGLFNQIHAHQQQQAAQQQQQQQQQYQAHQGQGIADMHYGEKAFEAHIKGELNEHHHMQHNLQHHQDIHHHPQHHQDQVYNSAPAYQNSGTRNVKRVNSTAPEHGNKRSKLVSQRDSTFSEAGKYVGDLAHYGLFDNIRRHLGCHKAYENFLRCLNVYNNEVISKTELITIATPFLSKSPELFKKFKDIVNVKEPSNLKSSANNANAHSNNNAPNSTAQPSYLSYPNNTKLEGLSSRIASMNRNDDEYVEVDVSKCKRYGASYRELPKNNAQCSGRTPLCNEVLNDTLVSFPAWSEDSTFVSSKKINYEEYLTRCEDERYELDQVLETNLATIRVFNNLLKKMEKMSAEDKLKFKLDDFLGGRSEVIHTKAIKRIYGDKATSVIEGLKNAPAQIVPIVYRRLLTKEEEWREAQKQFNKMWREQYEKYYLKSLDHQGVNFKQNDIKNLKPKSLFNEIENIVKEREKQLLTDPSLDGKPHIMSQYPDKAMIQVACNLIIHHVKRQTSINKEDKQKIKQLMKHFIPDLFGTSRGELSDDEGEGERQNETKVFFNLESQVDEDKTKPEEEKVKVQPLHMMSSKADDQYVLFLNNELWYCFFRYHHILCERLSKMHQETEALIALNNRENSQKKSFAYHLALKNELMPKTEDYFKYLIEMVKQVLDGNLESTQYEDTLREMFGIKAYLSFTLDKLVQFIVKQLQSIVIDEISSQCLDLYLEALKINAGGGSCTTAHKRAHPEAIYQRVAEHLLSEEYCFKLVVYRDQGLLTYEYLPSPEGEDDDDSVNDNEEESVSTQSTASQSRLTMQSSRTTRSTMKGKTDADQKLLEKVEKRIKDSPLFLGRLIDKYKSQHDAELCKKAASDDGSNDRMDVDDDAKSQGKDECELNLDNYNSVLIIHNDIKSKNSILYRRSSLKNAQSSHDAISKRKSRSFSSWHSAWSEKNCAQLDEQTGCGNILTDKP